MVTLDGPAGGGFLLDTNALHRGYLGGREARTAVMLEFHPHGKIPRLVSNRHVRGLPCPSNKDEASVWTPAAQHNWAAGVGGLPLYPTEKAARVAEAQRSRPVTFSRFGERLGGGARPDELSRRRFQAQLVGSQVRRAAAALRRRGGLRSVAVARKGALSR